MNRKTMMTTARTIQTGMTAVSVLILLAPNLLHFIILRKMGSGRFRWSTAINKEYLKVFTFLDTSQYASS